MSGSLDKHQHADNLSRLVVEFQKGIQQELTEALIEQAVADFRAKITPVIMERVTEITIRAMNSYYEPMRQTPVVNVAFTL